MSVAMEEHLCGCCSTILLINWMFVVLNLFEDWAWLCFMLPSEIFLGHWSDLFDLCYSYMLFWLFVVQYKAVDPSQALFNNPTSAHAVASFQWFKLRLKWSQLCCLYQISSLASHPGNPSYQRATHPPWHIPSFKIRSTQSSICRQREVAILCIFDLKLEQAPFLSMLAFNKFRWFPVSLNAGFDLQMASLCFSTKARWMHGNTHTRISRHTEADRQHLCSSCLIKRFVCARDWWASYTVTSTCVFLQ